MTGTGSLLIESIRLAFWQERVIPSFFPVALERTHSTKLQFPFSSFYFPISRFGQRGTVKTGHGPFWMTR
jgi:hypothetical protein